jgi:hypothetical protein
MRADYYRTLTELYERNFVAPLQQWAASRGVGFRIQGYGEPPATLSSYRFADLFEGEGWGWKDLPPTRWASSAAQIYGRQVVSSETWTWVHSPSLRATPLDVKGELHEHLLCGVNQVIGHGWPYSPLDADGIGWLFYAAGALDDRNPWWAAAGPLNRYVHRLSWLLRQGDRVSDVGLYVPARDVYAGMRPGVEGSLNLWRGVRDHIGPDIPRIVREQGFDLDLVDDDAVEVLDPGRFPVVVLPFVRDLPPATLSWLRAAEQRGGQVIAVGGDVEIGTALATPSELSGALPARLAPDVAVAPPSGAVGAIHRRLDAADVYLIANTGPTSQQIAVSLRSARGVVERWDPLTGDVVARGPGARPVPLTLEAYEAAVLVAFDGADAPVAWDLSPPWEAVPLDAAWTVRFPGDPEAVPASVPHRWEDTPELSHFSGTAIYTASVRMDHRPAAAELDLGAVMPVDAGADEEAGLRGRSFRAAVVPPVGEVADVVVNGSPAGVLWSTPYRLRIGHLLRAGANQIQIKVSNTAANALAADPFVRARADESARRHGRRFRMQDLGLATADVNSGLLAVPRLLVTHDRRDG